MALFELLAKDVNPIHTQDKLQQEARSVCTHLNQLLNARRGVLHHLKDYGLPDVEDIYEGLPYSQQTLSHEVKKVIEKYEPRVKNVLVQPIEINQDNCVIKLNIQAYLTSGISINLDTQFASGGKANVKPNAKSKVNY